MSRNQMAATLLVTLSAMGCDPGWHMHPVGWAPAADYTWSSQLDGAAVQTRAIGGLIGERWLDARYEIAGNPESVILRGAVLKTDSGTYQAEPTSSSISARVGGGTLSAYWRFDEDHPIYKVLGERCEIVLDLLVGSVPRTFRITYEHDDGRRGPHPALPAATTDHRLSQVACS